ncbi:MAG: SH3 domain-containing protein [Lachnospiraceae bacterium]|nr:SH3 domain-containing protein [Lachnospiraceae bacterium]
MENKKENKVFNWFKDVWELIKNNKKTSIITAAFIVAVAVIIILVVHFSNPKQPDPSEVVTEPISDEYVISDEPLEVDAYPEINELMRKYYDASAAGDVATIESIKTAVNDKEKIVITKKSEYVESYPVVTCYTKKGPIEDTFMVFAYYEVKLKDYDNTAPGLNAWYVCKREDGTYYINDDEQDEKLKNYCKIISVQDDVVDLNNTVNVKFNEVVNSDTELAAFLELLPELLTASVGEELAKANDPEADTNETVDTPSTESGSETVEDTPQLEGKEVKTTDVVNIRSSDSETADKVGKAQKGDKFTVLEQKVNGWSKIEFEGKECYIKSEYLVALDADNGTENTNTQTDEPTNEEAAANSPSSGTAKATDTVNIRKTDSTEAEKVTVAYKGEEMTVLEKQSNGWTKVKFNGKTGYVKSEYLE